MTNVGSTWRESEDGPKAQNHERKMGIRSGRNCGTKIFRILLCTIAILILDRKQIFIWRER